MSAHHLGSGNRRRDQDMEKKEKQPKDQVKKRKNPKILYYVSKRIGGRKKKWTLA